MVSNNIETRYCMCVCVCVFEGDRSLNNAYGFFLIIQKLDFTES